MQCTSGTSAYHEVRFFVHFCLAIWANFEQGDSFNLSNFSNEFVKFSHWAKELIGQEL